MQGNELYGARGGLSAVATARLPGDDDVSEPRLPFLAWLSWPRPSPVYIAFWMTVSACVVILGIAAARNISFQNTHYSFRAILASLLRPTGSVSVGAANTWPTIGKLRSRASFASESEFLNSQSFKTARLAGTILPLALYCKDRQAVALVKSVLGTVTGKDPYHAELMAIGWLARHRNRIGYRPTDCSRQLPEVIADLRSRT
jgi:hypothetical protein